MTFFILIGGLVLSALIVILGITYRLRGWDGFSTDNTTGRIAWSFPNSLIAFCISLASGRDFNTSLGLAYGVLIFTLIAAMIAHGKYLGSAKVSWGMGMKSAMRAAIMMVPMVYYGFSYVSALAFIALCATAWGAYAIGWIYLDGKRVDGKYLDFLFTRKDSSPFVQGGAEWGELLTGACYALAWFGAFIAPMLWDRYQATLPIAI